MAEEKKEVISMSQCIPPAPKTKRARRYVINCASCEDGDWMAYTKGRYVILRNLADPSNSAIFSGHQKDIGAVAFSPDGSLVASGDQTGKICIWGRQDRISQIEFNGPQEINDIAWTYDGNYLIVVGSSGIRAGVFFSKDGKPYGKKLDSLGEKRILSCSTREGKHEFLLSSESFSAFLYQGQPFKYKKALIGHTNYANCVKYSPDGEVAITVGSDMKIVLWEADSGKKIKELTSKKKGHKGSIFSFSWSPCGKNILTVSADKTAKIWSVDDGTVTQTFKWENNRDNMQQGVAWLKGVDQEYLITVSFGGAINYLDPNTGEISSVLSGVQGAPNGFSADPTSSAFYIGTNTGQLTGFNEEQNIRVAIGKGHNGKAIRCICCNCDGEIVYTAGDDKKLFINETKELEFGDFVDLGGYANCMSTGKKDSTLIAVGLSNDKVIILQNKKIVSKIDVPDPMVMEWNPTDKILCVGIKKKEIRLYDFDGTDLKLGSACKEKPKGCPKKIQFKGNYLSVSCTGGQITIYDLKKELKVINDDRFEYQGGSIYHAWNPDGTYLAWTGSDYHINVYKMNKTFKKDIEKILVAHVGGGLAIHWLDNTNFLTMGKSGAVKVWTITPW